MDPERNSVIYGELDRVMENTGEDKPILIFGDFNGHVGFLSLLRDGI